MLFKITLLSCVVFSVLYPLCFWIHAADPLKNNFHRFHIGLPTITGVIVAIFIALSQYPPAVKIPVIVWALMLFLTCAMSWKKNNPNLLLVALTVLGGAIGFHQLQTHLLTSGWTATMFSLLGGSIFCASLYAMNLGHWYLNVHGLPIGHLLKATYVFWILLGIRAIVDLGVLSAEKLVYQGNLIYLHQFIFRYDGFLLWVGLLFGIVFPFISLFFAKGTLALKNTQATTGILYVILGSVLLGDMAFKYYLIKYGIAM